MVFEPIQSAEFPGNLLKTTDAQASPHMFRIRIFRCIAWESAFSQAPRWFWERPGLGTLGLRCILPLTSPGGSAPSLPLSFNSPDAVGKSCRMAPEGGVLDAVRGLSPTQAHSLFLGCYCNCYDYDPDGGQQTPRLRHSPVFLITLMPALSFHSNPFWKLLGVFLFFFFVQGNYCCLLPGDRERK